MLIYIPFVFVALFCDLWIMRKIRRKINVEREPAMNVKLSKYEYNRFVRHDQTYPLRKNIVARAHKDL